MEAAGSSLLDAPQAVFDALADPTRRRLIERLSSSSTPITVSELAEAFPISRQAVSKHLTALEEAGLVLAERQGRERRLTFDPEPLNAAAAWIANVEARWDARLAALQRMLSEEAASVRDEPAVDQATRTEPQ
jgi:DNA-binding transcriptional ArsR family regulator